MRKNIYKHRKVETLREAVNWALYGLPILNEKALVLVPYKYFVIFRDLAQCYLKQRKIKV
jgi:hypothetical protein